MVNLKLIKLLCAERNISLRELAKQVNISEVGLQRIIRTNSTKVETLEKIADVLNVEISKFFPTTKTHKSFLDNNEFEFIKTLSKRYDKFSDQISFFKDYFVTVVMRGIDKGYKPKYPEEYPSPTGLLINDDQMNRFLEVASNVENIPFSKWKKEYVDMVSDTWLFFGFYFPMFDNNFMNIIEYLEDSIIKDEEMIQNWKIWKEHVKVY